MFLYNESLLKTTWQGRSSVRCPYIYKKDHHLILIRPICQPKPMSTEGMTKTPITVKNMVHNLLLKLRT